jgi:hypothetical protein
MVQKTKPFFSSTHVQIGDGRNTLFWEARWLNGSSPKDLAPGLYNQARFKKKMSQQRGSQCKLD